MDRRCLPLTAIAVVALALASPLAVALDPVPSFTLASTAIAHAVFPGEKAIFSIAVGNPGVIPRDAKMNVTGGLPPGYTYAFTPDPLAVGSKGSNNTTLEIFVPNGTAPTTLTISYEANDTLSAPARANVTVTVKARAEPVTVVDSPPPAPTPPRLSLSVTPESTADEGTTVSGVVTLRHDDPARSVLDVRLSASGPAGWNAYFKAGDQARILGKQGDTRQVPVHVDVPDLAADETVDIIVTAVVESTTYTAHWTVNGVATRAPTDAPASATSTTTVGGTTPVKPTGGRPATGPNFDILVLPLEIDIESGGSAVASVQLENTGATQLTIALSAPPPAQWRPAEFEARQVTLLPGEKRAVDMQVFAPAGVPSGGVADLVVQGASDGVYRQAKLVLHTVPPALPADETASSSSSAQAPAPEGSSLPSMSTTALVAVGLAAVGSSALVLVNRPLREKLLWGAAGLYTRLARPDVLGHEDREKLYRLVETQPGIHFHALQRDLAWNTGTLTYHLRVLEKHGFLVSRRDGLYRRFYLSGAAPRKEVFENQGPSGLRADVIEAIKNSPGISQSDLALGLGANKQTVNYHVKALERAGSIRVEKKGRDTYLYPGGAAPQGEGQAHA